MRRWLNRGELSYEVSTAPEGDGFIGIISQVRRVEQRVVWQAEWRRLDLPRPTQRLAEDDARALAVALLDQAEVDAAAAKGTTIALPHVTADEVIARARAVPSGVIGDGLYQDLGRPLGAYYFGFEHALQDLPPPKEIPASATIYWAGYRDGEAAHPKLLDAGVLSQDWGSREHWRDLPITAIFERTVMTDRDVFADYTVDLLRLDLQPVYEPGYPPAEGEIRDVQVHSLYRVSARLHERPLPLGWLSSAGEPEALVPEDFRAGFRKLLHSAQHRRRRYNLPQREIGRSVPGQLDLVEAYDPPEYDASSALAAMKRTVGSVVALLEEYRQTDPDAFVRDLVTVTLQRRAAELRFIAAHGPTQIPEISDERAAELGESGREAQRNVHDWNEGARRGYEERIAPLPQLEAQIRARGADPDDAGGWMPPSETGPLRYGPSNGRPALGWDMRIPAAISDDALLAEITALAEAVSPGTYRVHLARPGVIEFVPLRPDPPSEDAFLTVTPGMPGIRRHWRDHHQHDALLSALHKASRRWRVAPWAVPQHWTAEPQHWGGPSHERWTTAVQWRPSGSRIEVQLAPPGSRLPDEREC